MKAASDLAQERLTVVEVSGSDGSSDRHRGELEVTQSARAGRLGLGDTRADRFGLNFQCFCPDLNLNAWTEWIRALPGAFPNRVFEVGRGLLIDDVVFDARDESHHVIAFPFRHV